MATLRVKNRDFQRATGEWLQKARQGNTVLIVSPEGPPLTLKAREAPALKKSTRIGRSTSRGFQPRNSRARAPIRWMRCAGPRGDELPRRKLCHRPALQYPRADGGGGTFRAQRSSPFILSELAELECRRAFVSKTGKPDSEQWLRMQSLVESGAWKREPLEWKTVSGRAAQIVDRSGARLGAGTLDTLHVAQAMQSGCTHFLSFDSNSNARVLAAVCRLKVFPELAAGEKQRVAEMIGSR